MGYMVGGTYHIGDDVTQTLQSGEWERSKSTVRHWITVDGAPGLTGDGGFKAEHGRYHLFVAWNCPWAHRTLVTRALKGLEEAISVSYARPNRTDQGWVFDEAGPFADPLLGVQAVHEVYSRDSMDYTGRLTVPVLWDKRQNRMVSNESADIMRMLGLAFDGGPELYPLGLQGDIDRWNDTIYASVNNGVYRVGFASTQEAYEKAAHAVFEALNQIDEHLGTHRFLCGDTLTEADVRLFPTLARFDVAYHYAFRCNLKKLTDYANLWPYARALFQMPGVADTVRFDIYKQGYFSASEKRNPLGIVPIGPQLADWTAPHGR
ncbi:MAG: glutathione S-transferase C-terminal domain-containing protein [Rhizobiales bacterium]|nr:glutathione S-transferase C-terminal domain-containing protein [Hyphomicrobiales bacterium]MBO6698381.1 glutathione S-transferase C-terminal domain-containing protein [Hyphomicrobiales bacterium]MBO6735365.1 glutathione S-transferase C-terminal domain-containing protein [Hyphomicrobiales bacterium]MBO6910827.1 glutathione S-transferase C-terminal domain-containing protein [Hyphomicrobiales bacterium]MBO6957264.1 glutathione S-transferase C-terminal domain-containing protein [Hyphomicrobiales